MEKLIIRLGIIYFTYQFFSSGNQGSVESLHLTLKIGI